MQQPASHTATIDGLTLNYLDLLASGEQRGVVLFLHGSGPGASGWSNFKFNAEAFSAAGYRVVIPDLPGYGLSDKPTDVDYTLDYFVGAVSGLLSALDLSQLTVVGNSLGGAIALGLALAEPTAMGSPEFTRPVLNELLKLLVADPAHVTEALLTERWETLQRQNPRVLATMQVPNMAARLGELNVPVQVFWGADDQFCPASGGQKFIDHCANVRLNVLTRCGHWVMVEYPDYFNRQCLDFIAHS